MIDTLEPENLDIADRINAVLSNLLSADKPFKLWEAMRYSVFAGGKRLRPRLILAACSGFGGDEDAAMPFACAVEMLHTYSLIHDDLPEMDNDDLRRGKPTCHIAFGHGMAVLAGDALLNLAYEVMCGACAAKTARIKAMAEISRAAGAYGMVAGQAEDMLSENKTVDESTLLYIHDNKTAAIIRACIVAGGILGGADIKQEGVLSEAGGYLGRAFQIKDDLLDVTMSTQELGKPAMSDIKNNKATYVSLYGKDRAKTDCNALTWRAMELIDGLKLKNDALFRLAGSFYME